jgi:hypothetical protein
MMVSEHLSLAQIDDLAQVDQGMQYPENPPEVMGLPYRVSAILKKADGTPVAGAQVSVYDATGKILLANPQGGSLVKMTDSAGRVYFDLKEGSQITISAPGYSPPYAVVTPFQISVGAFAYLFKNSWDWNKSTSFIFHGTAPGEGPPMSDGGVDMGSIILLGAVAVGGYFLYQYLSKKPVA